MDMISFHTKCPEIAEKELRYIVVKNHKSLMPGKYFLLESYCNDSKCDCRRVFINLVYNNKILATIGYGWEDLKFYEKWIGEHKLASYVKGPTLEIGGFQTKYSDALLKLFKKNILKDRGYIELLKRHYKLFKRRC